MKLFLTLSGLGIGVYLLIISIADVVFGMRYFYHASDWQSSNLCYIASLLANFTHYMSVNIEMWITLQRVFLTAFIFKTNRIMKTCDCIKWMFISGAIFVILDFLSLPSFPLSPLLGNLETRICFRLRAISKDGLIQYGRIVGYILHTVHTIIIICGYTIIVILDRQSAARSNRSKVNFKLLLHSLIICSKTTIHFVTYLIFGLATIQSSFIFQISTQIVVFVISFNSLINPLIFIPMKSVICTCV